MAKLESYWIVGWNESRWPWGQSGLLCHLNVKVRLESCLLPSETDFAYRPSGRAKWQDCWESWVMLSSSSISMEKIQIKGLANPLCRVSGKGKKPSYKREREPTESLFTGGWKHRANCAHSEMIVKWLCSAASLDSRTKSKNYRLGRMRLLQTGESLLRTKWFSGLMKILWIINQVVCIMGGATCAGAVHCAGNYNYIAKCCDSKMNKCLSLLQKSGRETFKKKKFLLFWG